MCLEPGISLEGIKNLTFIGKHGFCFSHVIWHSIPFKKVVLLVLWGVNAMSWSMYCPHTIIISEYRLSSVTASLDT